MKDFRFRMNNEWQPAPDSGLLLFWEFRKNGYLSNGEFISGIMMMKRIFFTAFLLCIFFSGIAQTKTFFPLETLDTNQLSLSLELVKPNGRLDHDVYFLARLKNLNDSLTMVTVSSEWKLYTQMESYYQNTEGKEYSSNPRTFFDFETQRVIKIKPSDEYIAKFPLFTSPTLNEGNGLLPPAKSAVRKTRRVCLKIRRLKYQPTWVPWKAGKFYDIQTVNLQSNWIEIDGEAFAGLMTWDI